MLRIPTEMFTVTRTANRNPGPAWDPWTARRAAPTIDIGRLSCCVGLVATAGVVTRWTRLDSPEGENRWTIACAVWAISDPMVEKLDGIAEITDWWTTWLTSSTPMYPWGVGPRARGRPSTIRRRPSTGVTCSVSVRPSRTTTRVTGAPT